MNESITSLSKEDIQIYEKLYDRVSLTLKENNSFPLLSKEVFLSTVRKNYGIIDYGEIKDMDNQSFFESVYYQIFNRLPDDKQISEWEKCLDLSRNDFQKKVISDLVLRSGIPQNLSNAPEDISHWYKKVCIKYRLIKTIDNNKILTAIRLAIPKSFRTSLKSKFMKG